EADMAAEAMPVRRAAQIGLRADHRRIAAEVCDGAIDEGNRVIFVAWGYPAGDKGMFALALARAVNEDEAVEDHSLHRHLVLSQLGTIEGVGRRQDRFRGR